MVEEFGLTDDGFKKKSYNDIIQDLNTRAKGYFGEKVNVSESSPMGYLLRISAWFLANIWEQAENLYYSSYIDTASGTNLDRLVKYLGLTRLEESASKGEITITGDPDYVVESGLEVSTVDGIIFVTTEEITLDSTTGEATAEIQSVEKGSHTNVASGAITEILDDVLEITSVTNSEATVGGTDLETDAELRERYNTNLSGAGSSTLSSIASNLLNTEGVIDVVLRENVTMTTDGDGIPAKSIAPVVYGGTDVDVAKSILDTKAAGIQCWGNITITVEDNYGNTHDIGITRPTEIPIYIESDITINSEIFPEDGIAQIKQNIIDYIGESGIVGGLGLGSNVIYTKVISTIHEVEGITDISLQIGTDPAALQSTNISIGSLEVAITSETDITITTI